MLKPEFLRDDQLAALGPLAVIMFAGFWCAADRPWGGSKMGLLKIKAMIILYGSDCLERQVTRTAYQPGKHA